jgi:NADH:ubiquinone oxidoreductase subunit F (NADH-binding)
VTAVDEALGPPADRTGRLMAAIAVTAGRPRLAAHLEAHLEAFGPMPLPGRHDREWATRLVTAIGQAGLTGRGGAGFPTGRKLVAFTQRTGGRTSLRRPVVVVNLMESEPASGKDRALAIGAPHLVLDGAVLVATAVRATAVEVCVGSSHHEAARSVEAAIDERLARGVDPVPVLVARPPGRYVSGEESALTNWLSSGDARPTFRAVRPAVVRVDGRPALVDNAETLAHLAMIARFGPEWFRSVGEPDAAGTALLTVSGAVARPAVYEVALGSPLRSVLDGAGAHPELGGVLLGGYGGAWLAADRIDVPLAAGPLAQVGCTLGAGVVVALPATSCGLAETARIVHWMAGEGAGQCGPCAFGLPALADDLAILAGLSTRAPDRQLTARLHFRLGEVRGRGACRHPDGVVGLVGSALACFAGDVDRHLKERTCPGVCAPSILPLPCRAATRG